MPVHIKSAEEIEKMRTAGRLAAEVLEMIAEHVRPGVTTNHLNDLCHAHITEIQEAIPAPLHYQGFPKSVCTTLNHQVCHGIPSERKLKSGDILNIDVTVIKDGYHGDTSRMFLIGKSSIQAKRLTELTYEALRRAIGVVRPGATLGDIGHCIQSFVESHRYSVVREYCGHGIGRAFHEEPSVLHYGRPGKGLALEAGMTFTIEPMINAGRREIRMLPDKWTAVTRDRSLSAQWEHTILVTATGAEVLTARTDERFP